jgi:hypothetical protein
MAKIQKHKFIFICGLHRSGTSLLYKILKEQKNISGLENTNEIEDEGQFVQSIYSPAYKFGGVGRFGFNKDAELNEESKLITKKNRNKLYDEWSKYWDTDKEFLLEKSPPNIIRTRFLQAMFPNSYFINITRHPIATSLATKKWSKTSLDSLINHWITCHKKLNHDKIKISRIIDIKYEDLIKNTDNVLQLISNFLETEINSPKIQIRKGINIKYFNIWEKRRKNIFKRNNIKKIINKYEDEINVFNYSLTKY